MNPLDNLLAAVHDAHLRQRELARLPRLRSCREPAPQRAKPARRAPAAASPAPTFAKPRRPARKFIQIVPSAAEVLAKADTLPSLNRNDDGQFSAPALTAWYVDQIIRRNHYRSES